jgi:ADP-heptose:LPS heptosyltransferase
MGGESNILLLHVGGVGDLVLAADLIASIRVGLPDARVELACRESVAGVAELMPMPPHATIPLRLNPYLHDAPSPELLSEVNELTGVLAGRRPSILIAGAFHPTWLEWFLAAALRPSRVIAASRQPAPRGLLAVLLKHQGLQTPAFETPGTDSYAHEKDRYAAIAQLLGVDPVPAPPWTLPEEAIAAREQYLSRFGLNPGEYVACFPYGAVAEKCWPAERFHAVLEAVREEHRMPALLIGTRSEEEGISRLQSGLPCARKFIGDSGDLPLVAGLLESCRVWVGNDTGPMHLAQAYRKPGVAVFGGGANAVYGPWAPGALGFIHPLPCFGCLWDCAFGRGFCVESIPVDKVREGLREVLSSPPPRPEMRVLEAVAPEVTTVMDAASARHREAQRSRKNRFNLLVELEHEANERLIRLEASGRRADGLDAASADLRAIAEERAQALLEKEAALTEIRDAAEQRERGMNELNAALQKQNMELEALRRRNEELAAELDLPAHKALARLLKRRKNQGS